MNKPNDVPAWVEALSKLASRPTRVTRAGYAVVVPNASPTSTRFARGSSRSIDSQVAEHERVEVSETKELIVSETMGWSIHGPRRLPPRHTRVVEVPPIETTEDEPAPPGASMHRAPPPRASSARPLTRSIDTRALDPRPPTRTIQAFESRSFGGRLDPAGFDPGPFAIADEPPPRRRSIGRWLALASVGVLAAAATMTGIRMWRSARVTPAPLPSAVIPVGADRLELAPDRRTIARVGRDGTRWTSIQPAAVDTMKLAGSLLLALTPSTLVAVDLERGSSRFAWEAPAGERWSPSSIAAVDSCLTLLTTRGQDSSLQCLDLTTGAPRWTAVIPGGHECLGPAAEVPGAFFVQCSGWSAIVEAKTGKVTVEAGGIGLVQHQPPILLRGDTRGRLVLATWSESTRRFNTSGTTMRGSVESSSAAVQRGDRIVVRASSASTQIATILHKSKAPIAITAPELQLAADVPLVRDCDLGTAPRFQLLELAPRAGTTFDPELATTRVLALLDTDAGRLAWTSRRIVAPRESGSEIACKHGHYFVPMERGLWILDAMTGETTAAFRFSGNAEASFVAITSEQIGADQILAVGRDGVVALRWRERTIEPSAGIDDGRVELERELGRLP